jgi:radical SAM protein with 4Fe4S-binding SPASM domain
MVWLATDACNLRCRHCSSASACRSPAELSTREAFDLVDSLVELGVMDLAVSGGEPLLRRDLFAVLDYVRQRGLSVGVGSNGTTMTAANGRRLASCGIGRWQVSLDGMGESHDSLRRCPGLFERVVDAIAIARDAGLRVHVCCTLNRLNRDEIGEVAALVAALGAHRLNISRFVPTGRGSHDLDLSPAEWRRAVEQCVRLREEYRGRLEVVSHLAQQILVTDEVRDVPGFIGCQAGRGQGCVTATGDVLPCVLLPVVIGNVRHERLARIWATSPVIQDLQDRSRLHGACGTCRQRSRCGGCRAVAYAKTGDYLERDERCWLPLAGSLPTPADPARQDERTWR